MKKGYRKFTNSFEIKAVSKDVPDTITFRKRDLAQLLSVAQLDILDDEDNYRYKEDWYSYLDQISTKPKSLHVHEPLEDLQIVSDAHEGFLYVYLKGKLIHCFMIGDWL